MVTVASSPLLSYEEARKQRVEENNRRMQALGLVDLAKSLKPVKKKELVRKSSHGRKSNEVPGEARRSSRMAGKPAVSYRDQLDLLPGMRMRIGVRDRQPLARRYLSDTARMATIDAAEEVYKGIKNPAFVKPMLRSHTASCFWLGLPANFCKQYMPDRDEYMILEDDKNMESECLYLARKAGLSGGWRGWSLEHELVDGDCCIFELVESKRFKVYIFRCEEDYEEANADEDVPEKKVATKKKKAAVNVSERTASASSPPDLIITKKVSSGLVRKSGREEGNEEPPKPSRKVRREVDKDVDGLMRSSKRTRGKGDVVAAPQSDQKALKSKNQKKDQEGEDVIELDCGDDHDDNEDEEEEVEEEEEEDNDDDDDFKMPAAARNTRRTRKERI